MRKPNRRARRNAEKRGSKRFMNTLQPVEHGSGPDKSDTGVAAVAGGATNTPALPGQSKASQANTGRQYGKHIVWGLVTVRRFVLKLLISIIGFLDKYDGAVTAVATLVICFLTWEYVTYSKKQWEAMQNSNTASRNTLVATERPWVGPDFKESPIALGKSGEPVRWRVYFRNSGNSPALRTQWHVRLYQPFPAKTEDFKSIEKDIEQLMFDDKMNFTIFKDQEMQNVSHSSIGGVPLIPDDRSRSGIAAQALDLVLGGRVAYQDEFDNPHETTFCILYLPARGNGTPESWQGCPVRPITN